MQAVQTDKAAREVKAVLPTAVIPAVFPEEHPAVLPMARPAAAPGDQSAASQGAASQSAGTAGSSLSTAAGTDNRIMYVTVMNGKVYTLVFIEQSAELSKNASDSAEYIFNSLEYTVDSEVARVKEHKKTTFNILLAVCSPLGRSGGILHYPFDKKGCGKGKAGAES